MNSIKSMKNLLWTILLIIRRSSFGALLLAAKMFIIFVMIGTKNSSANHAKKFIAWNAGLNITSINPVNNIESVSSMITVNWIRSLWNLWRAKNSNNARNASFGSKKCQDVIIWDVDVGMNLITLYLSIKRKKKKYLNK